ncbi:MAG: glycosyltransferase [Holophagales bacterium]|nr:glycosyltransferase [Holophagales bacterium]
MSEGESGFPPLVLAGMHRSGTSFLASQLASLGVDMGSAFPDPDRNNRPGYFEDGRFLELNRRMLAAACPADDGGHPDWGWTERGLCDGGGLEPFRDEARSLVLAAGRRETPWGWKDPRTTVLLDFWRSVVPQARFLLVYRTPWEVADSLQRLGAPVFSGNPRFGERIWLAYNAALLSFHRANRARSVLASTNRLMESPDLLAGLVGDRLGLRLEKPASPPRREPDLFATWPAGDPIERLHALAWPDATALLGDLDAAADLPSLLQAPRAPRGRRLSSGASAEPSVDTTIVTPVHDDGAFLVEALASAERTSEPGTELILVDDGSTEPFTVAFLSRLEDEGYRVIRQPNRGLSSARNTGIRNAHGRFLLTLDADNRIREGYLRRATRQLEADPGLGVVYGDRYEFGLRTGTVPVPDFHYGAILKANCIDACAVFRKSVWLSAGGFDETLPALEDWDFWLSAADAGWRFHHLPATLFDYRVRPGGLSDWLHTGSRTEELTARIQARHRGRWPWRLVPRGLRRRLFSTAGAAPWAAPSPPVRGAAS